MAKWCLIKSQADKLVDKLKKGEIDPEKLAGMTSAQRRKFFEGFLDEKSAKNTNLLFEKKIIQKNRDNAMMRWVEGLTGITSQRRKEMLEKIKARRQETLERIYDPKEEEGFLNELIEDRIGISVTSDEAKVLFKLTKEMEDARQMFSKNAILNRIEGLSGISDKEKEVVASILDKLRMQKEGQKLNSKVLAKLKRYMEGESPSDEVKEQVAQLIDDIKDGKIAKKNRNYGVARVALDDYIEAMKFGNTDKAKGLSEKTMKAYQRARELGIRGIIVETAGFAKSVVASIDNSFIGRQGIKTLFINPKIWFKRLGSSFIDLGKTLVAKDPDGVLKGVRAEIYSRENSMNGIYERMKLDVGIMEEAYPSSLPEKIPLFGRFFKASNTAFTATGYKMRADLADFYIEKAIKNGADFNDKQVAESWGKLINSLTGRGNVFIGNSPPWVNVTLFSPKFVQSQLDFLTAHVFDKNVTKEVKIEAGKNLLKVVAGTGSILWIANVMQPGSVEWDARSSDFGKIRIGDARFDISGGAASYITLATRMWRRSTKSATSGLVTESGDFGGKDYAELMANFAENKLSPLARAVTDSIFKGENFEGEKIDFSKDAVGSAVIVGKGLLTPIFVGNTMEFYEKRENAPWLAALIADAMGIGANIYGYEARWETRETQEMSQFREKLGVDKLREAEKKYNKKVNDNLKELRDNEDFQKLSNEEKSSVITRNKNTFKDEIFKEYGFEVEEETKKEKKAKEDKLSPFLK